MKLKLLLYLFILVSFISESESQVISSFSVNASGNDEEYAIINYTIGQVFVNQYQNKKIEMTNGFQQGTPTLNLKEDLTNTTLIFPLNSLIKAYPIPTYDNLNVDFTDFFSKNGRNNLIAKIYDMNGSLLIEFNPINNIEKISLSQFSNSTMIFTVEKNGTVIDKFTFLKL